MTPRRASSSTRPPNTKSGRGILKLGDETEYRIARLFVWMGYFVRRGREIYTAGRLDQATDLDVLATKFGPLFAREVITIECKTGREGPLDRVFWLSGVRHYIGADRAILYRPPTKWNIRDFAKEAGVEILDPSRLTRLERRYVAEPNEWIGLCDWKFLSERLDAWNKILRANPRYKELYQTLVTEVRYEEPFALVAFWIHHLRGLTRDYLRESSATQELIKFLISDAVGQLAVCFLRVAQLTSDLDQHDRRGVVEKKLIYGEQEPRLVERVFESAYRIARAAARDKLGTEVEIEHSLFRVPRPDYVAKVISIVEELVDNGEVSADLPQIVDIIMSEAFLKNNRERRYLKRIFPRDDIGVRTAVAVHFLKCMHELDALPVQVEELLDPKQSSDSQNKESSSVQPNAGSAPGQGSLLD